MKLNAIDLLLKFEELGFSASDISEMIGVSRMMIYHVKRGDRAFSSKTLYVLALKYVILVEVEIYQSIPSLCTKLNQFAKEYKIPIKPGLLRVPIPKNKDYNLLPQIKKVV